MIANRKRYYSGNYFMAKEFVTVPDNRFFQVDRSIAES